MGRKRNVRRKAKQLGIKRSAAGNIVKTAVHTKPVEAPPIDSKKSTSEIDFEDYKSAIERQLEWEERMFRNPIADAIERQERMFRNPVVDAIEKHQKMFRNPVADAIAKHERLYRDPIAEALKHSVVDQISDSATSHLLKASEPIRQVIDPILKMTEPFRKIQELFPFKNRR
jgi:hypothetical protein